MSYSCEILCVGTELLLGDIVNTNAAFLSRELAALGIPVYRHTAVGDNPERLKAALTDAFSRCNLVVMTGGLGPTYDDLTKETVASLFGLGLHYDEPSLRAIEDFFTQRGKIMTENNRKQALVPDGSVVLANRFGMAPGMAIEKDGKIAILLPGPPSEIEPMFADTVKPYLQTLSQKTICSRFIHIFGMGEATVEAHLKTLMESSCNPTLAPYAKDGEVRLRVTAQADSEAEAYALCDGMIETVKKTPVGGFIFGIDVVTIEEALVRKLTEKGVTVASAESCTGGYIAKRITDVPGSSAVLKGAVVSYTNEVKIRALGVSPETIARYSEISCEAAEEMARGVRLLCHADIAVSTTGFAGPGGGTEKDPVGTVYLGISTKEGERSVRLSLPRHKSRETVRYLASNHALMALFYECDKY